MKSKWTMSINLGEGIHLNVPLMLREELDQTFREAMDYFLKSLEYDFHTFWASSYIHREGPV